jgi:hypothetical protein
MATAVAKVETKTVEKEVREKVYKLELTELEAKVLLYLLGQVAGDRLTSYRRETSNIFAAMRVAGVPWHYATEYVTGTVSAAALKAEDA